MYVSVLKYALVSHFTDHGIWNGQLSHLALCYLADNIAPCSGKEISWVYIVLDLYAKFISKGHLAHCLSGSMALHCVGRQNFSSLNVLKNLVVTFHDLTVIRQIILVSWRLKYHNPASGLLKLRCNDIFAAVYIDCKGNQRRRNIDFTCFIVKGS